MSKKKEEFLVIRKNDYRKSLLKKVRSKGLYKDLGDSKIVEKLLELYIQNPGIAENFDSDIEDIKALHKYHEHLEKGIIEIYKVIQAVDSRLLNIEKKLKINKEEEEDLF